MNAGIIVLGMHRSGTSLLAELVHRWGAYGAEEGLIRSGHWNARGYWEHFPLVQFNDELLSALGAKWNVPPAEDRDAELQQLAREDDYRRRANELLEPFRRSGKPWFWKDPRLCVLLPFWKEIWGPVCYVESVRNPVEVGHSLLSRNHLPVSAGMLLWQRYVRAILKHAGNNARTLYADYAALTATPDSECARLCKFLDCAATGAHRAGPENIKNMIEAVQPALHHNSIDPNAGHPAQLTPEQRQLHCLQRSLASGDGVAPEFDVEKYPLYSAWHEYLQTAELARVCVRSVAELAELLQVFGHFPKAHKGVR